MIISARTVISSLQSDRLTKRFKAGKIRVVSVAMTSFALLGFSISHSFAMLCLFAIPYGLSAGSVDAALNNHALFIQRQFISAEKNRRQGRRTNFKCLYRNKHYATSFGFLSNFIVIAMLPIYL